MNGTADIQPIVIRLGKKTRKAVKKLKRGEGPLAEDVREAVSDALLELDATAGPDSYLPVVVIYEEKPKKSRLPRLPMAPFFPIR